MSTGHSAIAGALTAAILSMGAPEVGAAEESTGKRFYVSMSGLYGLPFDSSLDASYPGGRLTAKVGMESGFGFTVAGGYKILDSLGVEIEAAYRQSGFGRIGNWAAHPAGAPRPVALPLRTTVSGNVSMWSVLANVVFEVRAWKLRPYGGFGVGFVRTSFDFKKITVSASGLQGIDDFSVELAGKGTATSFAYQGMAGVAYPVSDRVTVRVGYRFFEAVDPKFGGVKIPLSPGAVEVGVLFLF